MNYKYLGSQEQVQQKYLIQPLVKNRLSRKLNTGDSYSLLKVKPRITNILTFQVLGGGLKQIKVIIK